MTMEPEVKAEAEERQKATQLIGKGIQKQDINGDGNFPQPSKSEKGETRDIIASYVGKSGKTLEKAEFVVKALFT